MRSIQAVLVPRAFRWQDIAAKQKDRSCFGRLIKYENEISK